MPRKNKRSPINKQKKQQAGKRKLNQVSNVIQYATIYQEVINKIQDEIGEMLNCVLHGNGLFINIINLIDLITEIQPINCSFIDELHKLSSIALPNGNELFLKLLHSRSYTNTLETELKEPPHNIYQLIKSNDCVQININNLYK